MISLTDMVALANALITADKEVAVKETELSEAKERARQLREESIPTAMMELELTEVTLATGQKITIKPDVYASIPAAGHEAAYDWLEKHGFGGLIKTHVVTEFGKGELDKAKELADKLVEEGLIASVDRNVHAQTLKAFLREQLAKAADVPLEIFGARPVWTAKIK